jgi:hypothetical protein
MAKTRATLPATVGYDTISLKSVNASKTVTAGCGVLVAADLLSAASALRGSLVARRLLDDDDSKVEEAEVEASS